MSQPKNRRRKGPTKARKRSTKNGGGDQPGWDALETSLRGLRTLNAMQLELMAKVEQIGKQLRRQSG